MKVPVSQRRDYAATLPAIVASELAIHLELIREREAIRLRKESGVPWPWTANALLRDYRRCNVRRREDRVSVTLMCGWYDPHADARTQLVVAVLGWLVGRVVPANLELEPDSDTGLSAVLPPLEHVATDASANVDAWRDAGVCWR